MNAKIFYPAAAAIALLMIALSFVWPQGQGQRSPAPFGHAIETPDYYRMVRERDARRQKQAVERAQREKLTAAHQAAQASASVVGVRIVIGAAGATACRAEREGHAVRSQALDSR